MKIIKSTLQELNNARGRFQENVGKSRAVYMALAVVMSMGASLHRLGIMSDFALIVFMGILGGLFIRIVSILLEPAENIFDAFFAAFLLGFFALTYVSAPQPFQPVPLDQFALRALVYVGVCAFSGFFATLMGITAFKIHNAYSK